MSASPSLIRPSVAELRALIETADGTPWLHVVNGNVVDCCDAYSEAYSNKFYGLNIDHVQLIKHEHSSLAVHTRDAGIVLFDPTFRQFYHDYPEPYFLGTPSEMLAWVNAHGGMKRVIEPYPVGELSVLTAGDCLLGQEVIQIMGSKVGYNPITQVRRHYEWAAALRPIEAHGEPLPWAARMAQTARSSNEVSP